jgi:hypothetical protein
MAFLSTLGPLEALAADKDDRDAMRSARLDHLDFDDFSPLRGQAFRLQSKSGLVGHTAWLIEAERLAIPGRRSGRAPFSLVFDVPNRRGLLQGTYVITHPRLGVVELFLVAVDRPDDHGRLQAIFT